MRVVDPDAARVGKKSTEGGLRRGTELYDAEVAEHGLAEDNARNNEGAGRDDSAEGVREDVLPDDSVIARAEGPRRHYEFLVLKAVELGSYTACRSDPARQHEGEKKAWDRTDLGGKVNLEQSRDDYERNARKNIGNTMFGSS